MTRLQEAAYAAELAAGLPTSPLGRRLLTPALRSTADPAIDVQQCTEYLHAVQDAAWFRAAFPGHVVLVEVVGTDGLSAADAALGRISIGAMDRCSAARCERACLHELAHIVTSDHGPDRTRREDAGGRDSSKGHHHAWRVNFVQVVRQTLGSQAANRLRREFDHWGMPTCR